MPRPHNGLEDCVQEQTAELAIFRKFAESSPQGFGMGDLEGRIAYVNPALCRLFGEADCQALVGKKFL